MQIIISGATKKEFIFSTAIFQVNLPILLKINSSKRIFQQFSNHDLMLNQSAFTCSKLTIWTLEQRCEISLKHISQLRTCSYRLNLSARFTLLNPHKESKQKLDHIVSCSPLLNIGYDRIANFDLLILPLKYINSVKHFRCFRHSIWLEGNSPVIRGKLSKKWGKKLRRKKEEGNFEKEEGNCLQKNTKGTLKRQGRKYRKKR